MSVQTKKRINNLGKIIGGIFFALLLFTNIKLSILEQNGVSDGDISILGVEINLFEAAFGEQTNCCKLAVGWICTTYNGDHSGYRYCDK